MSSPVIDEILLRARDLFTSEATATKPATATSLGGVKLRGDLAGTAENPTVPGLASKADKSHSHEIEDVGGLDTALVGKAPKASPTFTGTVTAPSVKLTSGAAAGRVLTSAADGTAAWEDPVSGAPGVAVSGPTAGSTPTGASAAKARSVAIGNSAVADNDLGTATGAGAQANYYGAAVGADAVASALFAQAFGGKARATHEGATAVGYDARTTSAYQLMMGATNATVVAPNKFQVGPDGTLSATLSTRTNGSGKTELIAQFATGSPIVIATQP